MKKNKINKNEAPLLNMAVSRTRDIESPTANSVYNRVQRAIDLDSAILYNGNDEQVEVPLMAMIRAMHPLYVHDNPNYEGPFDGWDGAEEIIMVDGSRCSSDAFVNTVCLYFSDELLELWAETLQAAEQMPQVPTFLGTKCVAIRVTLPEGVWFEYIIEKAA